MTRIHTSTLCAAALLALLLLPLAGCAPAPAVNPPPEPVAQPEPEPILITEVNLDDLFAPGLPVILNFGDSSPESAATLAALERINATYGDKVLIRSADLSQNPDAREGFPVQIVPSQFFYAAGGEPIPLLVNIGIPVSSFLAVDTEEPVFTAHEGPLTEEELLVILENMSVSQ